MNKVSMFARYLIGIIFLGAGIAGLTGNVPPPEPESAQAFMTVLVSSGVLGIVKIIEVASAIALLSGFFVPAALFLLAPIIFNILWFHGMFDPSGLPIGIILTGLWFLTAYSYKNIFLSFLQLKQSKQ